MESNECYGIVAELARSAILAPFANTKFDLMTAISTLRYCYSYQHSDYFCKIF